MSMDREDQGPEPNIMSGANWERSLSLGQTWRYFQPSGPINTSQEQALGGGAVSANAAY